MRVGELCNYAPKSQIKAGDAVEGAEYMFFTSSADETKRYPEYQLDGEGIIMGTGGNATLHYYSGKFATSTDCVVLLPNSQIKCKYLYYFFRANMGILEAGFKGAGLRHTNKKYINDIGIKNIPNHDKQDEVISTLDKLQGIIEARNKELRLLDKIIKARFVELFGDSENNSKKWSVYKLNELCDIGSSKRIYQEEQTADGIPFWRISDLVNKMDIGRANSELYISHEKYNELIDINQVPVEGDILVTSRGTLGRCYIISDTDEFYFQDGMISWLSKYKKGITPLYIKHLFMTPGIKRQIEGMQAGSTVAYLSIAMLKKLDIMLPDSETQHLFEVFVKQVDKSKVV